MINPLLCKNDTGVLLFENLWTNCARAIGSLETDATNQSAVFHFKVRSYIYKAGGYSVESKSVALNTFLYNKLVLVAFQYY